jgi:hypothetical protein
MEQHYATFQPAASSIRERDTETALISEQRPVMLTAGKNLDVKGSAHTA